MEIQQMQSLLLKQGIRIANDDPIFTLLALNEIVLDEMTERHRKKLDNAGFELQKVHAEMKNMADALVAAAEIAAIGRQILSGENEQVLNDIDMIKKSINEIAQKIANGLVAGDRDLGDRMEIMATTILAAIVKIKSTTPILQRQNEAFLLDRISEITTAVLQLKDMQGGLQLTANKQIESIVAPVVLQMSEQVKKLADKDTFAMRFMQRTHNIQEKMADITWYLISGSVLLVVLAFATGYLLK